MTPGMPRRTPGSWEGPSHRGGDRVAQRLTASTTKAAESRPGVLTPLLKQSSECQGSQPEGPTPAGKSSLGPAGKMALWGPALPTRAGTRCIETTDDRRDASLTRACPGASDSVPAQNLGRPRLSSSAVWSQPAGTRLGHQPAASSRPQASFSEASERMPEHQGT